MVFTALRANIDEYVKDKLWYWHIPLWLFGLYIFVLLLHFNLGGPMPFVLAVPQAFDFMLHEVSHIVTAWMPPLLTAAAGSGSEFLLGAGLVYGAFRFRNYFASLFCCLWFMLACQSIGDYMADARAQHLPLVSLGAALSGSDAATHDWHFIFGQLHMLSLDTFIGGAVRALGTLVGLFGVVFSAWIIYRMAVSSSTEKVRQHEQEIKEQAAQAVKHDVYPTPTKGSFVQHAEPDDSTGKKDAPG